MGDTTLDAFVGDIISHMPRIPGPISRLTYPRNINRMGKRLKERSYDLGSVPGLLVVRYKQNGPRFVLFGETQTHIDSYLMGSDYELYAFRHTTDSDVDTKVLEQKAREIGEEFVSETSLPCVVTSAMKGHKAGYFLLLRQKYGQVITSQRYWDEVLPQPWEGRS